MSLPFACKPIIPPGPGCIKGAGASPPMGRLGAGPGALGTTAHPIRDGAKGKPVLEERFVVTIRVDRIGNVAEHVLDQLLGITRPPQYLCRFGVRIQFPIHRMDIPRHAASHTSADLEPRNTLTVAPPRRRHFPGAAPGRQPTRAA